jgi:hypothetical protein
MEDLVKALLLAVSGGLLKLDEAKKILLDKLK